MSKVNQLFERKLSVVNFGIESFYQDLIKQGKSRLPAGTRRSPPACANCARRR